MGDVHNYERRLVGALKNLDGAEIDKRNRNHIRRFIEYKKASKGISLGRQAKYVYELIRLAKVLDRPFNQATKADLIKLANQIRESKIHKPRTNSDCLRALKVLYKWLEGKDDFYPDKVRWLRPELKPNEKDEVRAEDMIVAEEMGRMISCCKYVRDKAVVSMLWDSGFRVSEFLTMRYDSIHRDNGNLHARAVESKTIKRLVILGPSQKYVEEWLAAHPTKNPADPLWLGLGKRKNQNLPLGYDALRIMLRRLAKKAGIKKPVNPQNFRRSQATHMSKGGINQPLLEKRMGWTFGSKAARVYIKLSQTDADDAAMRIYGIETKERPKPAMPLKPKKCPDPECAVENPAEARVCMSCGLAFDMETQVKVKKKRKEMKDLRKEMEEQRAQLEDIRQKSEVLNVMLADDEFRQTFRQTAEKIVRGAERKSARRPSASHSPRAAKTG